MEARKVSEFVWEIPKSGAMKVPARIFASDKLMEKIREDRTLAQSAAVATLPGIYKYAITLPDAHEGYGFPIGGVAALDFKDGCISPGGIGYDINCGVRLLRIGLTEKEVRPKLRELLDMMFHLVPSGVGSESSLKLTKTEVDSVLNGGARWLIDEKGLGTSRDLEFTEENGSMKADAALVSTDAKKRGSKQIGTLGAGNHFLEIQKVGTVFNSDEAEAFGLNELTVMIHCGSRGLGHQVCSDYLRKMENAYPQIIKGLADRELVYAPAGSQLANEYLHAMSAAANYAWANRQAIAQNIRLAFENVFKKDWEKLGIEMVYDVAHNICKVEEHEIDGHKRKVYIHRKGATRSFPPGSKEIPQAYRKVGQPVLIPGSMGTASYVLRGSSTAMDLTFGSTAHGAGRVLSRSKAIRTHYGQDVSQKLAERGILVKCASWKVLAEEAPDAYKDIDEVARVSDSLGIGKKVARLLPIGVVKG